MVKLRGEEVFVDKTYRVVYIDIRKPYNNTFSISDSALAYLDRGYTISVNLPDRKQIITKEVEPIRKESVKSKFRGGGDWYRYWFRVRSKSENKQQLLFN